MPWKKSTVFSLSGTIDHFQPQVLDHRFSPSLLKGRPVYIGLAVDISDYEINIDPSAIKPLDLSVARNPKDVHQAAMEAVLRQAKKAKHIVVIVDA